MAQAHDPHTHQIHNIEFSNLNVDNFSKLIAEYNSTLEKSFSQIVRMFNKLHLADYTVSTLTNGTKLIQQTNALVKTLTIHTDSIKNMMIDGENLVSEIKEELSQPVKPGGYVYHTTNGMLSYPAREVIQLVTKPRPDPKLDPKEIKEEPEKKTEVIREIVLPEIKYRMKMTTVTDLKQIPTAMYFYKPAEPAQYPAGVYINVAGNYIRIPFSEIVDSKKEYDRKHSIRCKYKTIVECDLQRAKMAKLYDSTVRSCNFAHKGDKIIKIGYPSRCPSMPAFGNPASISNDIKFISTDDIKNMLMYGLNDVLISAIWLNFNNKTGHTIVDLDTA